MTRFYAGAKIFTERFAEGVLAPSTRRTARLDSIVHHLGLALGGRPAAGFAKRLMLPVSKDTLLRVVRRRSRPPTDPLKVIGIDDWAWRRNHRYASIICNLERRRVVTLLPDPQLVLSRAFASQAASYVIAVGGVRTLEHTPDHYKELSISEHTGDSFIIDPRGEVVAQAGKGETILIAEGAREAILAAKAMCDIAGHYSRPDLLRLSVNREPSTRVTEHGFPL